MFLVFRTTKLKRTNKITLTEQGSSLQEVASKIYLNKVYLFKISIYLKKDNQSILFPSVKYEIIQCCTVGYIVHIKGK